MFAKRKVKVKLRRRKRKKRGSKWLRIGKGRSEEKRGGGEISLIDLSEPTNQYMKEIEGRISDCSPEEKIEILFDKLRYWRWSAIDWRNMLERRKER